MTPVFPLFEVDGRFIEKHEPQHDFGEIPDACPATWEFLTPTTDGLLWMEHQCMLGRYHGGDCICACAEMHASDATARGVALLSHPLNGVTVELIDERLAFRLAVSYDDGAMRVIDRIYPWRLFKGAQDMYLPRYVELRDFLLYEHDVPLVLAARIALRLTVREIDRRSR